MKKYVILASLFIITACSTVSEIERTALKDEQMQLNPKKNERFEIYYQTYREGASGANGGKVGGGCGCN